MQILLFFIRLSLICAAEAYQQVKSVEVRDRNNVQMTVDSYSGLLAQIKLKSNPGSITLLDTIEDVTTIIDVSGYFEEVTNIEFCQHGPALERRSRADANLLIAGNQRNSYSYFVGVYNCHEQKMVMFTMSERSTIYKFPYTMPNPDSPYPHFSVHYGGSYGSHSINPGTAVKNAVFRKCDYDARVPMFYAMDGCVKVLVETTEANEPCINYQSVGLQVPTRKIVLPASPNRLITLPTERGVNDISPDKSIVVIIYQDELHLTILDHQISLLCGEASLDYSHILMQDWNVHVKYLAHLYIQSLDILYIFSLDDVFILENAVKGPVRVFKQVPLSTFDSDLTAVLKELSYPTSSPQNLQKYLNHLALIDHYRDCRDLHLMVKQAGRQAASYISNSMDVSIFKIPLNANTILNFGIKNPQKIYSLLLTGIQDSGCLFSSLNFDVLMQVWKIYLALIGRANFKN